MATDSERFLGKISKPRSVITPIPNGMWFPESLEAAKAKYAGDIIFFAELVKKAKSSGELLALIRSPRIDAKQRMSLLKLYRRCVALVLDTETTKKLGVTTESLVEAYSETFFKPISKLKEQFDDLPEDMLSCLAALLAENDFRGLQGYQLTEQFFDWFEEKFPDLLIEGRAGPDVELRTVFPEYHGNFPCDFVIRSKADRRVLAIGFARYDSTRGGSQSDDRTSGNANKLDRARKFCEDTGHQFRMIFLADGPGLADCVEELAVGGVTV